MPLRTFTLAGPSLTFEEMRHLLGQVEETPTLPQNLAPGRGYLDYDEASRRRWKGSITISLEETSLAPAPPSPTTGD